MNCQQMCTEGGGEQSIYIHIYICPSPNKGYWVDVRILKMARKPVKLQRKIQQDALGKVNRVKEIKRREKDGLDNRK